ncbi:MAG: hypothetical protein OEY49_10335, partial [Candidatus Heimdallarchaeota archaeon]|nr:hypothetical protein [Candidatus Heimdallarchaeota archaeon]
FRTVLQYGLLIILIRLFYKWGFSNYREAWYYFDEKEEILIVIRLVNKNWEVIEIPYEEIDEIEWNNDDNGYAIIKSYGMEFETNRSKDKRASSVTDLWGELARTSAKMTHWPIILICSKCDRKFGHHIGTAVCPWDETMLIDPKVKGGYEIKEAHPDDFDRI